LTDRTSYCKTCGKETMYTIEITERNGKFLNEDIEYISYSAVCNKCGNEIESHTIAEFMTDNSIKHSYYKAIRDAKA